uniref:Prostatic acid phosphatase n=1 Tax=Schizaphis graminum TaxID=13262 RepID=A0A2S2N7B8_SCHGA
MQHNSIAESAYAVCRHANIQTVSCLCGAVQKNRTYNEHALHYIIIFGCFHCCLFLCTQLFLHINVLNDCFYSTHTYSIMNAVKRNRVLELCISILISSMCPTVVVGMYQNDAVVNGHMRNEFDSNTLRLVHVVFRHGERTPADTYPLDPYINSSWEPFGWGQLTNNGKRKQYELGKFIRKRYSGFLDVLYSSKKLTFRSTDVDRTKMSAQLVASSMYKPVGVQKWNKYLDWQPVPIHSEPLNDDRLLLVRIDCPKYHEEKHKIMNSAEVLEELNTYSDLYSYLSNHTGLTIKDPDDVQSIYSTLKAEVGTKSRTME